MKKLTLMGIGVFLMTAIVTTAHADNTSSVHHDIALEGIAVVEISNSVGSIHVLPSRDGDLHIDVELEGKRKGFFRRKVNVEDMDLEIRERGDTIFCHSRKITPMPAGLWKYLTLNTPLSSWELAK